MRSNGADPIQKQTTASSAILRRRLTLPKFLFLQAQRTLERPVPPHSWGLATSLMQDSVEVTLRLIAESKQIKKVTDRTQFHDLLQAVEEEFSNAGGHRAGLTTMNTTRVAFKHRGQEVAENDARVFVANVEAFLVQIYRDAFDLDFASLSLADAIGHQRTQNWLARAEHALASEQHSESIAHSAKAMAVYLAHSSSNDATIRLRPIEAYQGIPDGFKEWVKHSIPLLRARMDLFTRGVDIASFDRFTLLTPWTTINHFGDVHQYSGPSTAKATREDARFCIDFVVDSALALRESRVLPRDVSREQERVRLKSRCDVIANPKATEREVIRVAESGEELTVASERQKHPEYLAVIDDGDVAYVRRECLATTGG